MASDARGDVNLDKGRDVAVPVRSAWSCQIPLVRGQNRLEEGLPV
jgi:hypothetical protein